MSSRQIHPSRVAPLNETPERDDARYVLYWMQQSQRAECNHALEYAIQQANRLDLPLLVGFGLMDDYPEANLRHYRFMLEGLADTQAALKRRYIHMVVKHGHPADVAIELAKHASLVICDRGYLRHQKQWRQRVADEAGCSVIQVESDVIVPVNVASNKAEYAARTIRPKIQKRLDDYLCDLTTTPLSNRSEINTRITHQIDLSDIEKALNSLKLDQRVGPVHHHYIGGGTEARKRLRDFIEHRFHGYDSKRPKPETDSVSHIAKYLHFGQISPITVALAIREADAPDEDRESFIEELTIRRELAINFVEFTPNYDQFDCLPDWAKKTLAKHASDERPNVYTREQFEAAETHDPYWNAAMNAMKWTGYLHNMMRMYWGKKILEWSASPQEGYDIALSLNNRYFLDGRDANSYTNVGWVFGLHDRPWAERAIFGTVRYMSDGGLRRKCDIAAFVRQVARLG